MKDLRGVLFANSDHEAQICMDRMCGLLGLPVLNAQRNFLVITPHTPHRGRGYMLPNRILMYDIAEGSIPDEIWHAIIPAIQRAPGEPLDVSHFYRTTQRTDLITDHHFTVRRQDGIGPHPPELECAAGIGGGELCGKRADQHYARPLARGAQDILR